jgi:hypothetical protein
VVRSNRKASHSHHLHKNPRALVLSAAGAILALFVFSWIYGTNYTGYVNVDINTVHFDERAFDGTRLIISSEDGQAIPMGAARISGKIYGEGDVRVYLVANELRRLVFSNTDEPGKFSIAGEPRGNIERTIRLDGSAFSFANEPERVLQLGVIEGNVQQGISEELPLYVRSACRETCRLHGSVDSSMYVFVFEMDPGTEFEVTDIGFS